MAALQCELCGGKLVGKPGGIFECDSCGMEYSTEWAKAKIQEIRGTVKVEGTVQVAGTVKVEGGISIENLLKRGWMELETYDWNKASQCFDEALNLDPECGEAYLGRACIRLNAPSLKELVTNREYALRNADFKKGLRFLPPETAAQLEEMAAATVVKFQARRVEEEQEKERQKQEKRRLEEERRRQKIEEMQAARKALEPYQGRIACGREFSMGIKDNGTVVARGHSGNKPGVVESWNDIICVSADHCYTVGVKSDGTTVAVAGLQAVRNNGEKATVCSWTDLVSISAGCYHTVGLKSNGTVVAAGSNQWNQSDVSRWRDIVQVRAGFNHTVGLRADGTVVAVGENDCGCCEVSGWKDMVAIAAGTSFTVGLRKDGTVTAIGGNRYGQCNVGSWQDIVDICAYGGCTVALKADGTVVVAGTNDYREITGWRDIVAIACGRGHVVGLTRDGKILAVGENEHSQCDIGGYPLLRDAANLRPLGRAGKKSPQELKKEYVELAREYKELSGLFAAKRRREIEARLAEIQTELKGLK